MMLSEPVIGERFFGRDDVLDLLKKRVSALIDGYRQNVALTGQNLAGKSSILHHFLNAFQDNRVLPIYVEVTDEPFFYFARRFVGSLLYNFLKSKGRDPKEDYASLIEESRAHIPATARAILEIEESIKRNDLDDAYSRLFDLTATVKEETGRSCVIILDEFHNLASLRVRHPFKNFGKKIMIQKDTMYIVTSSQVTTVKRILNEKLSLLFGNFEIIDIRGFSPRNAGSFLDQRFRYLRVPDELKRFIIAFTEGNPFYLDVLGQAVKDIVTAMTFKRISNKVIIEALERTIFNSKGCIFQYLNNTLESLKRTHSQDLAISILLSVANGSCRLKEISKTLKKRTGDISNRLADLIELNIIYKNGSFYKFVDRMFGFWLKFVYQKKRSAILSYLPDRLRIFSDEMEDLIDAFLLEEKKDIFSRINRLFGLFGNETVVISEKEYKLPAFASVETRLFDSGTPYIIAKSGKHHWIVAVGQHELKDIDIMELTERSKALKLKIQKKIFIAPAGIEMNANLMAKEEHMWIWGLDDLSELMALYGNYPIVKPVYPEGATGTT